MYKKSLQKKLTEALKAVCPIIGIVVVLSLTIVPIPSGIMLSFLFGSLLLIIGMMFFSLGAELAMETMGEKLGSRITKTRKLWLILLVGFLLGCLITMAEPDLQVLASQIPTIDSTILIGAVSVGVGLFLVVAFLRMVIGIPIRILFVIFYGLIILLSLFAPKNFQAVAFDSGGVTTGPMTVPFIMAFGVGIASIRSDRHASDDSFGLVALCSIGPILAVLIISLIFRPENIILDEVWLPQVAETKEMAKLFSQKLPQYLGELAVSLIPIVLSFAFFQLILLKLERKTLLRIGIGTVYTYVGLVLFMTGVNVGFLPVGSFLGKELGSTDYRFIIIPIGMLVGFFIVNAEPAIYVLMRQVEEFSNGAIRGKTLKLTMCISVSVSVGLSLLRVLCRIPIGYFVIPGYVIALVLSFFTPKLFTAIAFDSGGVASGPMTTTFLLPFATGACLATGGNLTTDAFGLVAMVAMTPLIAIQILGIIAKRKDTMAADVKVNGALDSLDNYSVIEL